MKEKLLKVELYSDGGARPNPGPGGYGVILRSGKTQKQFSGFEDNTTNNRMELTGVIVGLSKLKQKCFVQVFTDSSYVVNGIEKGWAKKWQENNWMRTKSEKAINYELWEKLLTLVEKHEVKFNWVRGHNGHEENEMCDELATNEILKNTGKLDKLGESSPLVESGESSPLAQSGESSPLAPLLSGEGDGLFLGEGEKKSRVKIKKAGDKCRKCGDSVVEEIPKKKNTKNKHYYYEYYLSCKNCKTNYFIEEAKVYIK